MHPPIVPTILLGLIAREEFAKYLAEKEHRILYGTHWAKKPTGIINYREGE